MEMAGPWGSSLYLFNLLYANDLLNVIIDVCVIGVEFNSSLKAKGESFDASMG